MEIMTDSGDKLQVRRKHLLIEITQEDIENGVRLDMSRCPIALALRRRFPDAKKIEVARDWITIDEKTYLPSWEIRSFISNYDSRLGAVEPFSFDLNKLKSWES